jgi:hypothetical protein
MKRALAATLDPLPWAAVDGLRAAWRLYDGALGGGSEAHHAGLDALIASLKAHSVFHPYRFYAGGVGDHGLLPGIAARLAARAPAAAAATGAHAPALRDVTLTESVHGRDRALVLDGTFTSPADPGQLPSASHSGAFQVVVPRSWAGDGVGGRGASLSLSSSSASRAASPPAGPTAASASLEAEMAALRPVVVLLPGTGEQGFRRRRHCVSYPLARLGIASLILEGPYYGSRRPPGQPASKLGRYMDLITLGAATVTEAVAIVGWLRGGGRGGSAAVGGGAPVSAPTNDADGDDGRSSAGDDTRLHLSDRQVDEIAAAAAAAPRDGGNSDGGGALNSWRRAMLRSLLTLPRASTPGGSGAGSSGGGGNLSASLQASQAADVAAALLGGAAGVGPIVLAGTSMGGLHAAMAACQLPLVAAGGVDPVVGVTSWLGPPTAAPVFTLGALSAGVDWAALAAQCDPASPAGGSLEASLVAMEGALPPQPAAVGGGGWDHAADVAAAEATPEGARVLAALTASAAADAAAHNARVLAAAVSGDDDDDGGGDAGARPPRLLPVPTLATVSHARRQVARLSTITDLTNHPPPAAPGAAVFATASRDLYIPRTRGVDGLWRATVGGSAGLFAGADARTVRGGHVSGSIFAVDAYVGALVEAVRRAAAAGSGSGAR